MSAEVTTVSLPGGKPVLLLAEYDTPAQCMKAAEKLRDAGFTQRIADLVVETGLDDTDPQTLAVEIGFENFDCHLIAPQWPGTKPTTSRS